MDLQCACAGGNNMANENERFLGTYFDRDAVIRMARIVAILSWVVAGIYILDILVGGGVFLLQYMRGFMNGMGFTDILQNILYILERPLHGMLYFAAMQAVSKGLLIFLDVEDNTRRTARRS
jgi:hypothetical protein